MDSRLCILRMASAMSTLTSTVRILLHCCFCTAWGIVLVTITWATDRTDHRPRSYSYITVLRVGVVQLVHRSLNRATASPLSRFSKNSFQQVVSSSLTLEQPQIYFIIYYGCPIANEFSLGYRQKVEMSHKLFAIACCLRLIKKHKCKSS